MRKLAILAVSLFVSTASADSITYSFLLNSKTQPGFAPLFDPSKGQLQEVIIAASGNASETVHFLEPIASGTYRQDVMLFWAPPVGPASVIGSQSQTLAFTNSPPSSDFTIGAGFSVNSDLTSSLNAFQGAGMANIQLSANPEILTPDLPHTSDFPSGIGAGSITYVFSVPEPTSFVLLFVGLAGVLIRQARPSGPRMSRRNRPHSDSLGGQGLCRSSSASRPARIES